MVITHAYTKTLVQRSVGSKDRVKTNKRTDDRFTFPASAVGKNKTTCRVAGT